ncbi:MAG TPA: YbaB/EbfC family nucleoid-associated protein, partial [Gemmataceae bacterium]|nr:YbaB/EbfC family nucleoid-associated protein [Gemmataceae bacterium]
MFKELGQMMGLMKQLPKIKEEMERLQQRLAQVTADGEAGAGLVKVRVNGKNEVVSCTISEEARAGDREVLEEMVRGAVNQALSKARVLAAEETQKMAASLGMPLGMGLPGMPA